MSILLGALSVALTVGWGLLCWLGWLHVVEAVESIPAGLLLAAWAFTLWLVGSFLIFGLLGLAA